VLTNVLIGLAQGLGASQFFSNCQLEIFFQKFEAKCMHARVCCVQRGEKEREREREREFNEEKEKVK